MVAHIYGSDVADGAKADGTYPASPPLSQGNMDSAKEGDQFKATKFWHSLVDYLRCHVSIKTRRYLLRNNDDCFTGSNAVDVVFRFLTEEGSDIITNNITRLNAVKVCQVLMDQHIFRPSSSWKHNPRHKFNFEDSPNKFYCFVDMSNKNLEFTKENTTCLNAQRLFDQSEIIPNPQALQYELQEPVDDEVPSFARSMSLNPQQRKTKGFLQRFRNASSTGNKENSNLINQSLPEEDFRCKKLKRSLTITSVQSPSRDQTKKKMPSMITDSVWKNLLLSKLLSLLNVSYLEGLLEYLNLDQIDDPVSFHHMFQVFSTNQSSRFEHDWYKLSSKYDLKSNNLPSDSSKKKSMFKAVVEHYAEIGSPLIPQDLKDIFLSILNLINENKYFQAAQALQLTIMLLPLPLQKELHSLLRFMQTMIEDTEVILNKTSSNRSAVLHRLSNAVLNISSIGDEQHKLVSFMIIHCDIIFSCPEELKKEIEHHLHLDKRPLYKNPGFSLNASSQNPAKSTRTVPSENKSSLGKKADNSVWTKKFHQIHPRVCSKTIEDGVPPPKTKIVAAIVTNI